MVPPISLPVVELDSNCPFVTHDNMHKRKQRKTVAGNFLFDQIQILKQ